MKDWVFRFQASIADLSPEQLALLLSVGLVLGVFPVLGCPTILCLLAAFGLRLNVAALQLLNNASSPLQLALLLPLERIGSRLCGSGITTSGSATSKLGLAALHAVAGWICVCVPIGVVLYVTIIVAVRKGRPLWFNGQKSPA